MSVTFITGNQGKADALAKWIGFDVAIEKLELDEIQSVDVRKVSEHKARQAYAILKKPVLVEDVGLAFSALNGLPGALIKWFVDDAGLENTARMLDGFEDRSATAICVWTYYDGAELRVIEGFQKGTIASGPRGTRGFGWDRMFIPDGLQVTRSELPEAEYEASYTASKNYPAVRELFKELA